MPFWSLRSRAERVVESVPAYAGFEIVSSCHSTSLWHGGFLGSPEMGFGWGSTGRALEQPDTTSPRPMSHVDCGASHGDRRAGRLDAVQAARRLWTPSSLHSFFKPSLWLRFRASSTVDRFRQAQLVRDVRYVHVLPQFLKSSEFKLSLTKGAPTITLHGVSLSRTDGWSLLNRATLLVVDGPDDEGFLLPRMTSPDSDMSPEGWDEAGRSRGIGRGAHLRKADRGHRVGVALAGGPHLGVS